MAVAVHLEKKITWKEAFFVYFTFTIKDWKFGKYPVNSEMFMNSIATLTFFWTHFVASGQMTHRVAQRMTIIIIFVRVSTATMGWNKHFVQNKSFSAFCEIWRVLKSPYPYMGTKKTRNAGTYTMYSPSCGWYINTMAFPVVEFSRQGYKIRKVFG